MSLLGEIKRRKVFQVAAVYAVVAWLLVQIVDVVNEPLSLPDWFDTAVIMALAIGFPIAVILAWAFDLTPEGVVKDQGTDPNGGRRIEYVLIGLLVVSVGWLAYRVEIIPPQPFVEVVTEEVIADLSRDRHSIAVLPFALLRHLKRGYGGVGCYIYYPLKDRKATLWCCSVIFSAKKSNLGNLARQRPNSDNQIERSSLKTKQVINTVVNTVVSVTVGYQVGN